MAAKTRSLSINIIGDSSRAKAAFKDAEKAAGSFSEQAKRAGMAIASAFVAKQVVNFAKDSIKAASNLAESINAVQVVFGSAAGGILKFGETAAKSVGMSQAAYNSFAVSFGAFTKQIAGADGDVAKITSELTTRIADFASVMNLDIPAAAAKFQSALAGQSKPMREFGIDTSAAAVEAFALATGMVKTNDEMTAAMKIQATYGLLMKETAQTAGDFANTSDSLANRQRILAAEFENMKAKIGEGLLPVVESLLGAVMPLIDGFNKLSPSIRQIGTTVAISTAVTTAFGKSLKNLGINAGVVNGAMGLLNVAFIAFAINQQQVAKAQAEANQSLSIWAKTTESTLERQTALTMAMLIMSGVAKNGADAFRLLAESSLVQAQRVANLESIQKTFNMTAEQAQRIINDVAASTRQYNNDLELNQDLLEGSNGMTRKTIDSYKEYYRSLINARTGIKDVNKSLEDQEEALNKAKTAWDIFRGALNLDLAMLNAKKEIDEFSKKWAEAMQEGKFNAEEFQGDLLRIKLMLLDVGWQVLETKSIFLQNQFKMLVDTSQVERALQLLAALRQGGEMKYPTGPALMSPIPATFTRSTTTVSSPTIISDGLTDAQREMLRLAGLARGGTLTSSGLVMVGEKGPELVSLPRAASVTPNIPAKLNDFNGNGTTIVINVQAGLVSSPDQVGAQIIEAIRRAERRSGQVFAAA